MGLVAGILLPASALAVQIAESSSKSQLGEDIRWVFGTFLFAFIVSEIAQKFAKLFNNRSHGGRHGFAIALRLALASTIALLSWIGWSLSVRLGAYPEPHTIFEPSALFVLIDAAIFTSYYSLVLGTEVSAKEPIPLPSTEHALRWTVIIFVGYLCWDLLVAYVHLNLDDSARWQYKFLPSAICSLLAIFARAGFRAARIKHDAASVVCLVDLALISLFTAFRALKDFIPWLPNTWDSQYLWGTTYFLPFAACTVAAIWESRRSARSHAS